MFNFTTTTITTRRGPRRIVVVCPTDQVLVGRARLELIRGGHQHPQTLAQVDASIVEFVRSQGESIDVVMMRCEHESGSWGTDPSLDPAASQALVEFLLDSQCMLYRELFDLGVKLFIHVETQPHDVQLFRAEMTSRAENDPTGRTKRLRQRVAFFSLGYARALERVGDILPSIESQVAMRETESWN